MINLLDFLKLATKPQSKKDLEKAGFTNVKKELKALMKVGLITKNEAFAHNTGKKYLNNESGKFETYHGTRFYTYEITK